MTEIYIDKEQELIELMTNDSIQEKEAGYALIQQGEKNLLSYSINGVFNETKDRYIKLNNKKASIPELTIIDSDGNEVKFKLTKEFVNSLKKDLDHVEKAYLGYTFVVEENIKLIDRIKSLPKDFKKNWMTYSLFIVFFIAIIAMFFKL